MVKSKVKHHKKASRFKLRNAARPQRAATTRPDPAPTSEARRDLPQTNDRSALYLAGGGAAALALCAVAAHYDVMPVPVATALVSALGGIAAVGADNPKYVAVGQGAMVAGGGLFGAALIENSRIDRAVREAIASNKSAMKKPSNAESLPPGALEAAYERARRRLAMAEASGQMAA